MSSPPQGSPLVVNDAHRGSQKRENVASTEPDEGDQPMSSPSDERPRKRLRPDVVDKLSELAASFKLGEIIGNQWKKDQPPKYKDLVVLSIFIRNASQYSNTPVNSKYTEDKPVELADRLKNGGDLWGRVYDVLQRCAQDSEWDLFIQLLETDFADTSAATVAFGVPDESTAEYDREQRIATVQSWKTPFRGHSSELLWKAILLHNQSAYATDRFANVFAILNSSGTGKSRTVDNFSREHFVIPICLRKQGSSGYPPSDSDVYKFFDKKEKNQDHGYVRCVAFLTALFTQATEVVKKIKEKNRWSSYAHISDKFRSLMEVVEPEKAASSDRAEFYRKVVQNAEKLRVNLLSNPENYYPGYPPPPMTESFLGLENELSAKSRTRLAEQGLLPSHRKEPVVFVAFDEANILQYVYSYVVTEGGEMKKLGWSYFGSMRRAFRMLKAKPIFGIFLSMAGSISQSNLNSSNRKPEADPSSRSHYKQFKEIPPFSDVGYDKFAPQVSFRRHNGPVDSQLYFKFDLEKDSPLQDPKPLTMDDARHIRFMARFGRALFPLHNIFGNTKIQKDIINFAISKLILVKNTDNIGQVVNADARVKKGEERQLLSQTFACLSQRLALEFNHALANAETYELELKQVEAHMRICLKTEQPSNRMVTTSGSEPLLSEAAAYVMSEENFNPPYALADLLQRYSICVDDRGELVAMLLAIIARDTAVGYPSDKGVEDNEHHPQVDRTVSVMGFFDGLLWNDLDPESQKVYDKLCEEAVDNEARMFFNHFIKADRQSTCTPQFILLCMTRAAALLCSNNILGINFLLPILLGAHFKVESLTFVLFQVQDDSSITESDTLKLFADMFEKSKDKLIGKQPPKFVIRVLMSLASQPAVRWSKQEVTHNGKKFPSYDCWVGGLDHNVLKAVKPEDTELWDWLGGVKRFNEMFMMEDYGEPEEKNEERMSMCVGGGSDPEFWSWAELIPESTSEVAEGQTDSASARDSQEDRKRSRNRRNRVSRSGKKTTC